MQITIGGNRVGSGKKMKASLNHYYRSTHNLSTIFTSTAASGPLYPALVLPAMRGDTFDIDIMADCRTIPTKGPLFGSYKLQVDLFECPVRLYQGILHNNPLHLGLNMSQVMLPKLLVQTEFSEYDEPQNVGKFANNCLLKYLGLSGIGAPDDMTAEDMERYVDATTSIAYYDIFKNYYSNKQEDKAYALSGTYNNARTIKLHERYSYVAKGNDHREIVSKEWASLPYTPDYSKNMTIVLDFAKYYKGRSGYTRPTFDEVMATIVRIKLWHLTGTNTAIITEQKMTISQFTAGLNTTDDYDPDAGTLEFFINQQDLQRAGFYWNGDLVMELYVEEQTRAEQSILEIVPFDLSNIDDMRYDLLSAHTLGTPYLIGTDSKLPYKLLSSKQIDGTTLNKVANNGLVLKTYQNDIFNNWLNTDWIEGPNGINELSKVAIVDGSFTMDSLNFAQKLYNMLNRVAVSGGTYEDWQDVVYEESAKHAIESPVFLGGMSKEIVFDEVVQSAPAEGDPLGTLGGRGRTETQSQKGGKVHVKVGEAAFIMAMASITPRLNYSQGNEFYMTELNSVDDFHKSALDGIGFQDLIGERLAYWDTKVTDDTQITHRSKIGKLPAWIEYMTNVNRTYGDFAEVEKAGYMVLNRNYEYDSETGGIKDATTYIDPTKFNYAFAYTQLDAQNFWLQIKFNITARRLMSARLIPNV